MHKPIRSLQLATLSLLLCACAWSARSAAGQQLPAIPPTLAAPEPLLPIAKPVLPPRHRAQVDYIQGSLKITADNSSLNQILGQIGNSTSLNITGEVADERVFGTYGPGDIAAVLTRLFDGFPINFLLRENSHRQPTDLILTPRDGGPTPPSAADSAQTGEDTEDRPPDLAPHLDQPAQAPTPSAGPVLEGAPATAAPAKPAPEPGQSGAATPLPAPTATQQSPNGVKTPQQIYDQLIQLQKQSAPAPPK